MGVIEVRDGDVRFTSYGWFRLLAAAAGLVAFFVWWAWSGMASRRAYAEFQEQTAGWEKDLDARWQEADLAARRLGEAIQRGVQAEAREGALVPVGLGSVQELWDEGRYVAAHRTLLSAAEGAAPDQPELTRLLAAGEEFAARRSAVRVLVRAIHQRAVELPTARLPEAVPPLLVAIDRSAESVDFVFESQEQPQAGTPQGDLGRWTRVGEVVAEFRAAVAAMPK